MALDDFRANQSSKASRQQKLKATNEPNLKSFLMFKSQEAICSLSASHCMLKHLTGNIYFTSSAHWYHWDHPDQCVWGRTRTISHLDLHFRVVSLRRTLSLAFLLCLVFCLLWVTSGHRSAKNYKYGHFQHGSSHNTNAEPWKCEIARKSWWIRWLLIVMVFECCSLTLQDQFNSINIIITGPSWQIALIWWKSAFCINLRFVVKPLQ